MGAVYFDRAPGMKTTYLLIVLNLLVYAAMIATSGEVREFSTHTLLEYGALYVPLVRQGQWWRIANMMFMHITPGHIAMNMIALYQVGRQLEAHLGRLRYLSLYLAAGLGGSLASLGWHALMGASVSAGASGAISGLIGAGVVVGHLRGGAEGRRFRDSMILWMAIVGVVGLTTGSDNAAHAGGFAAGALCAWRFDRGGRNLRRRVVDRGMGVDALVLVALVGGCFAVAAHYKGKSQTSAELTNAAVELARAGRHAEAIPMYRRALALEPDNQTAHFDLALALLTDGNFAQAERHARRATELDPSQRDAWEVLAESLAELGRGEQARAARERYKALGGVIPDEVDGGVVDGGGYSR